MPEDFPPGEFSEILSGENAPLIVGGQAVNIWAELYAPRMPGELDEFEPFTSRDADIYGDRMLAETLAKRKGWECHFMDDPASAAIAILKKSAGPNSPELTIEVLREVNGLTEEDLALTTTIELTGGEQYLIPSPIVLLKSKLYNLVSLANFDRPQDLRHAKMLMRILPHYFNELYLACRAGEFAENNLVGAIKYAFTVINSPWAPNAVRPHNLDLSKIFPASLILSDIAAIKAVFATNDSWHAAQRHEAAGPFNPATIAIEQRRLDKPGH